MSRFDYVKYDAISIAQQGRAKKLFSEMEEAIHSMNKGSQGIRQLVNEMQSIRPYKYARQRLTEVTLDEKHCFRALEECYMWIGKGIRDDQIARVGSVELQEDRGETSDSLALVGIASPRIPSGKWPEPSSTSINVELCARICHEANRGYCQALGDHSQLPWDDAPEWQKDSARAGVRFIYQNPEAGPDASHLSWFKKKESEGWKYGSIKDIEKKEHPCFVPYEQLPREQQAKDYIFGSIVRGFLKG